MSRKGINRSILIGILSFLIFSCKKEEAVPLAEANFYAQIQNCINDTCVVYFYDNSTHAVNWNWDFGNGQHSSKINDSTTYNQLGNFEVSLTVKNSKGIEAKKIKTISL